MNDSEGLVAVVTGGASGIGAAVAVRLQQAGASVAVLDINNGPFSSVVAPMRLTKVPRSGANTSRRGTSTALYGVKVACCPL